MTSSLVMPRSTLRQALAGVLVDNRRPLHLAAAVLILLAGEYYPKPSVLIAIPYASTE